MVQDGNGEAKNTQRPKSTDFHSSSLVLAAISAASAELLTFPIDTTKVYLQLQHSQLIWCELK